MGAPAKLTRIRGDRERMDVDSGAIDRFYDPIGPKMTTNNLKATAISVASEILREREALFPFTRANDI